MVCHNSVSSFNCTSRQHDQDKIKLITFAPLKFAWYIPQFSLSITSSSSLHGENFILLNISAMWRYNYVAGMGKILCPMNNFCCTVVWFHDTKSILLMIHRTPSLPSWSVSMRKSRYLCMCVCMYVEQYVVHAPQHRNCACISPLWHCILPHVLLLRNMCY